MIDTALLTHAVEWSNQPIGHGLELSNGIFWALAIVVLYLATDGGRIFG